MPQLGDNDLFKRIKQGTIDQAYLLFGKESYFVESCVRHITEKTVQKGLESMNLVRFDGGKLSLTALDDAVFTLPMMAQRKCVAIKDLDIDAMSKGDFDELCSIIEQDNDSTVLILYSIDAVYDIKKSSKLKKLSGIIEKKGVVCDFAIKDKLTLKRALCDRAKKEYVSLEMDVADALIERCSQSYSILQQELDKLIAYARAKGMAVPEIEKQDIELCCIASVDSTAFDLARAVLNRRYAEAFALLDELFYQRAEPIAILAALNMCFIDLHRAMAAGKAGASAAEVTTAFAYPANRSFAVKNAFRDVKGYSGKHLRACISALMEADIACKSSRLDDRLILERMLGQMAKQNV